MPAARAAELTRKSTRLSQAPSGSSPLVRETSEVRRSGRRTRTPAPPDEISLASGSSSKPPAKRVKTRPPERAVEKKIVEKGFIEKTLKRKHADDEEDVVMRNELKKLHKQNTELMKRCSKLELSLDRVASVKAALDQREQELQNWESIRMMSVEERAKQLFKKIENAYTCPLCVDVLACPYTITVNQQCGHTFCASCITQYTHLELNNATKTLRFDCPVCRKGVAWNLGNTRPCLWVPNRLVRESVLERLNELADILNELPWPERDDKDKGKRKLHRHDSKTNVKETVLDWRIGGSLRLDWERRDREGATKIKSVIQVAGKP